MPGAGPAAAAANAGPAVERGPSRGRLALLVLLVALIAHGSLYPWRFAAPLTLRPAMAPVLGAGPLWTGWADVVGNVLLFLPLGLLAASVTDVLGRALRLTSVVAAAALFAWSLQALQVWLPARDPAWSDAAWNVLGLVLGLATARFLAPAWQSLPAGRHGARTAWLLAPVWLAISWWPLLPAFGRQQWRDVLTPLLIQPHLSLHAMLEATLAALCLAALLPAGPRAPRRLALLLALGVTGKAFVWGQAWSLSHVGGLLAGWAGAVALQRANRGDTLPATRVAAAVAVLWYTAEALRPWQFMPWPQPMAWMPFAALLHGDLLFNLLALGWSTFWLGVVMIALAREDRASLPAALALGAWVLALEAVQTRLPGRVPDASMAMLPSLWWLLLRTMPPAPRLPIAPAAQRPDAA